MDKYTVKMFPQAYRDLDKIYEKGYSSKPNNTGLGLWEVRQIMKKNNNYKWVKHIIKEVSELEDGKTEVTQYVVIGFYAYKGYRQLFISGYIIIYEVLDVEKIVAILTIKYSGNDF